MIFFNLKIYTYLCLFYLYRRGSRHADADRKCEEFNNLILHSSFVKMTHKVRKIVSFLFLWQMFSFDTLYSVFPFSFELISRSCWWHSAPYNWLQSAEVNLHRLNGVTLAIDEDERLHRSIPNSLVSFRQQAFSWFHPLLKISHPSEASVQ